MVPRKRFKSAMVIFLAFAVILGGCGGGNANEETKPSPENTGTSASNEASGEAATSQASDLPPYEIAVAFRGPTIQKDLKDVEAEISKITKEKINATVKLIQIENAAWNEQTTLMLTANDKLDLMYTGLATYSSQVAKGQLVALDELLQQAGADILSAIDPVFLNATKINGKIYGVPSIRDFASFPALVMRKDILDKYQIDANTIQTLDDLENVFKTIKASEPNLTLIGPQLPGEAALQRYVAGGIDDLSDGMGVLTDLNSLKVVNLFETPEYAEILKRARAWYEAGYVSKDAATSKDTGYDLIKANKGFSLIIKGKPGIELQASQLAATPMVAVPLLPAVTTTSSIIGTMFSIAKNSEDPLRAMMFLNLMYSDKDITNLLAWGIEGKHYVKVSDNQIDFPPGIDASNSGYNLRQGWMFGNQPLTYLWKDEDPEIWKKMGEFNQGSRKSAALGFTFDSEPLKTEIAAVTNAIKQYRGALETGSIDPESNLPKFIAALKSAGIDKIVAEKQKQLDEWAKTKS